MWKWHFKAYLRKYCEQCQQLRVSVEVYILINIVLFKGKHFFFLKTKPKFRNITLLFYFKLKGQSWNFLYHFNDSPKRNLEMKIEISFMVTSWKKNDKYQYFESFLFEWVLLFTNYYFLLRIVNFCEEKNQVYPKLQWYLKKE